MPRYVVNQKSVSQYYNHSCRFTLDQVPCCEDHLIVAYPCLLFSLRSQISFFMIGVATIAMPFVPHFNWLIGMAFLFGLFDGCFISLLGPIAFDFCGQSGAAQAIGFLLGLCSVPLTLGPTVAGMK